MRRLAALLLLSCLAAPAAAQHLRIGIASDPDVLDPTLSRTVTGRQVFAAMCDKLVDIDEQLRIVPQLATAWRWEDGGRALVLTLRQGVRFHDGEALTGEAAAIGLRRHIETQGSTRRAEMGPVTEVVATGPLEVTIRLSEPFAPLLAALADRAGMLVSPRQARVTGADFQREPACAGPFRLTRRVAQDVIELERFDGYWDRANVHLARITYRPIPDSTVRLANLRAGALDIIERISPSDVSEVRRDQRVRLVQAPSLASFYIAINVGHGPRADTPLGRDARVREAFERSIDRQALVNVAFEGLWQPGNQSVPPSHPFYAASVPIPPRDVARARALLREAGQQRVRVRLAVPNTTDYMQASEVIQAMAAEAGFDVELQVIETATLLRQWTVGDFEALIIQWSGRVDLDANIFAFKACGVPLNGGRYCNPEVDAAMTEGRRSVDPAARAAAYDRAARLYLADRPYIYLWHPLTLHGTGAAIEGLRPVPDGLIRVQGLRGARG
ncbi:ABC transporter substrate-binding protein [Roseomonas sp. PWR1]|uniref:ABC transporter substrate-binding protein n=1 Tax=Roseomonas nitratireducens TaxID=2820810 RepID=A0ABS4APT8_9PROT|nr:ABC transporter substrate-binding protein [Neoroseomonas nitratireducens]MBP0463373.1 ABC transporter substrate-binding protein [Neoroseomonas nitratireducens]